MDYSNYNRNKEEIWCSWPIILLALYFFFPLGIYLIIRKSRLHRRNIFTIGRKTFSSAISLFIFATVMYLPIIIYKFAYFLNNENPEIADLAEVVSSEFYSKVLIIANFFYIIGLFVLIISIFQKHKAKQYQKYISLIVNRDIENLDEIADKIQFNKSKVIKDIKTMINKQYLENYELNIEENRIYDVVKEKRIREDKRLLELEKAKRKEEHSRVVQCPNCKADNQLIEKIGKCEYCRSYIE